MEKIAKDGYTLIEFVGKRELESQKFKNYWFNTFDAAMKAAKSTYIKKAPQFTDEEFELFHIVAVKAVANIRNKVASTGETVYAIHNETIYYEDTFADWEAVQASLQK